MFACPAFAITAIGVDRAAASFVIAVCRRSWKARGRFSTPAALRAAVSASTNASASVGGPALRVAEDALLLALERRGAAALPELFGEHR